MANHEHKRQRLHELLESLSDGETEAARQLLGVSLALGPSGAPVFRHFVDSLLLFGLGRLLLMFLERIGMPAGEIDLIHTLSKWYEVCLFSSFALFSLVEIIRAGIPVRRKVSEGAGSL